MLLKKALLSQANLNNAFLSKTDTVSQAIASSLTISGGQVTLKNSWFSDNANAGYLRIDPQGNRIIVYDGVNNQQLDIFSSSGSESLYFTTINQASNQSYGLIDVSGASVDRIEIGTNSSKYLKIGGDVHVGRTSAIGGVNHYIRNLSNGSSAFTALRIGNDTAVDKLVMFTNSSTRTADGGVGNTTIRTDSGDLHLSAAGGQKWTLQTDGNLKNNVSGAGLLFADGGGWRMTDTTWIRTTGGKSIYQDSGIMRTDGTFQVGSGGDTINFPINAVGDIKKRVRINSNVNASGWGSAAIEVRELNQGGVQTGVNSEAPRIAFHWGGRVASQIMINTAADICIMNDPGTGYEDLRALIMYAHGGMQYGGVTKPLDTNGRLVLPVGTNLYAT